MATTPAAPGVTVEYEYGEDATAAVEVTEPTTAAVEIE